MCAAAHSGEAMCGGQSKVTNLHITILVQKDVSRLQVPVNHALITVGSYTHQLIDLSCHETKQMTLAREMSTICTDLRGSLTCL